MKIKNEESKFRHLEQIQITNGYYKGYYGKITDYDSKTDEYSIKIKIEDKEESIKAKSNDLRSVKTLIFWK